MKRCGNRYKQRSPLFFCVGQVDDSLYLLVKNDSRIILLNEMLVSSGSSEDEFELKARMELDDNLRAYLMSDLNAVPDLMKIIVDFPQCYKAHTDAKTYFQVAYDTIYAECVSLGYACIYGCTLDFNHVYTIYPNGGKIPVLIVARCEIIVLPMKEEPGNRNFMQEISVAWECAIKEQFGIEPEDYCSIDLQTRIERELLQSINVIKDYYGVSEKDAIFASVIELLDGCLEITEQLAGERVDFPELFENARNLLAEVQRRENVVKVREKILDDLEHDIRKEDVEHESYYEGYDPADDDD
ncbi:MAG: hypothetical protein J6A77_01195 [Lachnospiraceae bacterium]|nr:hypothetical protein [Lachnospiraceae bacterium]